MSCKECPYKINSRHNSKFKGYVKKMFDSGIIKSENHTCHMIGNVWDEPNKKTVCIGSVENEKGCL